MRLFLRSIDVETDARLQRYTAALAKFGYPFLIAFWQRASRIAGIESETTLPYRRKAPVGARWGNAIGLLAWNMNIIETIWRFRSKLTSVQAVDLDSGLVAFLCCKALRIPVIFDIYDSYPDSRALKGIMASMARGLEGWIAKNADLTIIASEGRRRQHGIPPDVDVLVVENVPATNWALTPMPNGPLTIGYLGNLEAKHRGLEDMLAVVAADARYHMVVAGTGAIEGQIQEASAQCDRITFLGAVQHDKGLALMANCQIILGMYYLTVPNHRYAAPNKYYEHLILGRPLLTTLGTPPGTLVELHRTGWAINEGRAAIASKLEELSDDHFGIIEAGVRARDLWDSHYDKYVSITIETEYIARTKEVEQVRMNQNGKKTF